MDKAEPKAPGLTELDRILNRALQLGAVAAEVLQENSVGIRCSRQGGRTRSPIDESSLRVAGRVFLSDGRAAEFKTRSMQTSSIDNALAKALVQAETAEPDEYAAPAEPLAVTTRGLGIEDPRYPHVDDEARGDVLESNENSANSAHSRCLEVGYTERCTSRTFVSTKGVQATARSTWYEVRVRAQGTSNGLQLERIEAGRNFANVGSLPYGSGLARRLEHLQSDDSPLPPGVDALVLEPRVLAYLIAKIAPAFAQTLVAADKSFVTRFAPQMLSHPRIHVIDDGRLPGALLTRAFDDRGVPPAPVPIIREGRVGAWYHTPESARELDIRPTGHVTAGELVPSNLVLRAGNRSRTQMLGEVPLAIAFDHLDGTISLRTGNMNLSGPATILEKGKPRGVVQKVELRGNIVELLDHVVELAADQERHGAVDCATAVVLNYAF